MLHGLYGSLNGGPAAVIVSVAIMLFGGFLMTRLTKPLKLPNVTAYIVLGILIGPHCLDLIPADIIAGTDFLADVALAFIAFSIGEFFRLPAMKKSGGKVLVITLFEGCAASFLVFILTYWLLGMQLAFSVVLAALAAATAPASTLMTIRQTHAKGDFVDTLLQVVALGDVLGLIAYSAAMSIALSVISGGAPGGRFQAVALPVLMNIGALLLGGGFGFLLKLLMPPGRRSADNRLIISVGSLFAFCGVCALLGLSPLLGCMSMGTVYANVAEDDTLFKQLNYFSPPILLLFFVRSGLSFRLDALLAATNAIGNSPLWAAGALYFIVRALGKYAGAFLGCLAVHKPAPVRDHLGLALIPQAGVAIGLAALCARTLGGEIGEDLQTVILASSLLCELAGPPCAKLALHLSGAYADRLEDSTEVSEQDAAGRQRPAVEVLMERLAQIQAALPSRDQVFSDEENAFDRAAEEQEEALGYTALRRGRFLNRR